MRLEGLHFWGNLRHERIRRIMISCYAFPFSVTSSFLVCLKKVQGSM